MSLYVLDTDILSLHQKDHPQVKLSVDAHLSDDLAITVMSVEEQLAGWYRQLRKNQSSAQLAQVYRRLAQCVRSYARWQLLDFTVAAIQRLQQLKKLKLNVGGFDLAIAAITLEHGGILVSRNLRDFQRVPGLIVEDWSA